MSSETNEGLFSGVKDAQGSKIIRAHNSDFKIANNNFKFIKELSLKFRGRDMLSPFLRFQEPKKKAKTKSWPSYLNECLIQIRI